MRYDTALRMLIVLVVPLLFLPACISIGDSSYESRWPGEGARTWVGPNLWANRLQDWQVKGGRLECLAEDMLPMRTVHLLTHRLDKGRGEFNARVRTGLIQPKEKVTGDAAAGFLLGIGGADMDYRSAALIHAFPGKGAGLFAAVRPDGQVFFRDFEALPKEEIPLPSGPAAADIKLRLSAEPKTGGIHVLKLSANDEGGRRLSQASMEIASSRLEGNIALVSHHGPHWFRDWVFNGDKVNFDPARSLGPILSTQYTLSRGVLKITAQMMPVSEEDGNTVRLEINDGGKWKALAETEIDRPSFTAAFRIRDWDDAKDIPYRVAFDLKWGEGKPGTHFWKGTIQKDPRDKEVITVAGFTGNHNNAHRLGIGRGRKKASLRDWTKGIWFPHADVTKHVKAQEPDLLFFSGDQVYEGNSPTFADRDHIKPDYLYKWYLWCWAWRDVTKDIPAVTVPDDHDVYQGNLWGEEGRPTDRDHKGGYVHPADFVIMAERTQTSHLPDPIDPKKIGQGIGVYFTDMVYGRIGFAVIEDRKFKSGCAGRIEGKTRSRPDHINDPDFDMSKADVPGVKLLGERQLKFLRDFSADWAGQDMKIALSQTHFAGMATHHGGDLFRLIADLDSNGWPQSGRNRALHELRRGFVFHLCGDQHLSTLVQHGIDEHNDAIWAFCVPSVANFYLRGWMPEAKGKNRPPGSPPYLGEHLDGLGNRVTVYAVTNPVALTKKPLGREPSELNDHMPGYGIVKLDKKNRVIIVECWPRYADPRDPSTGGQYEGWPRTIPQLDNYGRKAVAFLPTLKCKGIRDPVVQVIDEADGEIVYTLRIEGDTFQPKVFRKGKYTLKIGEPNTEKHKVYEGVDTLPEGVDITLLVEF